MVPDYPIASLADIIAAYRTKSASPVEVLNAALRQAQKRNPDLNALFAIDPSRAMNEARKSEQRWLKGEPLGPLDGIPLTIKDSIKMTDMPYWRGCKANMETPLSTQDAPPAARLKEAGAVIFAKTAQPDLGMLASGVSSAHGIIRNAWDATCSPGGSSAGAGSSVAAGITIGSVGTDIAGSVRIPAAHNGLFGFKPTAGRVPHLPSDVQRCAGPLTRSVADGAIMFEVLAKPDCRDYVSLPPLQNPVPKMTVRNLTGVKIGLLVDMGFGPNPEAEIIQHITKAAEKFEQAGAHIETLAAPFDFDAFAPIERYLQARSRLDYLGYSKENRHLVLPYLVDWSAKSESNSAIDLMRALADMERAKDTLSRLSARYDFLISPVLPITSFPAQALGPNEKKPIEHVNFTSLFNQTGQPAASICCGFSAKGMPIGLQIIGNRYDDVGVIQMAFTYESIRDFEISWPVG